MSLTSFEDKRQFTETFQGQLFKYTNVVKGWCPRWFRLEPKAGLLDYFLSESEVNQKPRGTLELMGAVVSPSDEDSHTFSVSSASGDMYKLRASDAKERQEWVNRIRAVGLRDANDSVQKTNVTSKFHGGIGRPGFSPWDNYASSVYLPATNPTSSVKDWATAHGEADQQLRLVADRFDLVQREIEELPSNGEITNTHRDIIELNAAALLALHTLQDAIRILENDAYRPSVID